MSSTAQIQDEYWDLFHRRAAARGSRFAERGARNGAYTDWRIGRDGCHLSAGVLLDSNSPTGAVVQLAINGPEASAQFSRLKLMQEEIHAEVGSELVWEAKEGVQRRSVLIEAGPPPRSEDDWPTVQEWTLGQLEAFDLAFRKRL